MVRLAEAFATAARFQQAGQLLAAEQTCQKILAAAPHHVDTLHLLGIISSQLGKHDVAMELLNQAIALKPVDGAIHSNLGGVFRAQGKLDEAIECFHRAIELNPNDALAHYNLGTLLRAQGRLPDSVAAFRRAIDINPHLSVAHNNLGNVLQEQGHTSEAIGCFHLALEAKPDFLEAHNNLGKALHTQQKAKEAVACFCHALELNPNHAVTHYNLGVVLQDEGEIDEAVACFRRALELNPNYADAHNNLGIAFRGQGNISEAIRCYRRAVECQPDVAELHSNLVYAHYFCPGVDAEAIAAEHRVWNERHAAPLGPYIQPHDNDPSPDRRLRIGYVSPDFRAHCQAFFTTPLFSNHDHSQFEMFCYSNVAAPDDFTERARSLADEWRDIVGLSPAQIAQQVRQDRIDILVDLTMHMERGVPLVFAHKPAPVQVCWLAYPGTTGISAIDYRFTDSYLDPPGMFDKFYSEETIRLPHSFWCYDPLTSEPSVQALPALENGYITFGCLNNFCKVNNVVLKIWADVMNAVPTSRLILLAPRGSIRERTLQTFNDHGVIPDRITFESFQPRPEYLAAYNRFDICLDTIPANGHTTSMDAFWMGVPVPTIVGQTAIGRGGYSLLMTLGLPELIAETPQQYIDVVRKLAGNLPNLAELRATLRQRMEASPLMDGARFARDMEAAFRLIWRRWCHSLEPAR
jgi:protein O-GlcNAc transferase